jgi:hypothetical protein
LTVKENPAYTHNTQIPRLHGLQAGSQNKKGEFREETSFYITMPASPLRSFVDSILSPGQRRN